MGAQEFVRDACMLRLLGLLILLGSCLGAHGARAQQAGTPAHAAPAAADQQLSKKQIELVHKVEGYFNRLTNVKGTYVQTSADGKRERGKFYISRPGRFRFEFNRPSRVVIISDGSYVAIQDRDLNTDQRWDLNYTPFRALLQKDVNLLRDTRVLEVQESDDFITIAFEDKGGDASSRIRLFMGLKPALQVKAWVVRDVQGLDTRVDLTEVLPAEEPDAQLFDPGAEMHLP
jgi:outer membrane lipoprotein-sorting protein